MPIEIMCLLWSTLLGFCHINAQVVTVGIQQRGQKYDSNRDNEPELGLQAGRAARALRNFLESYPLFIALVVAAGFSNSMDAMTQWGSILYLAARVVYLPLYIFGMGPLRSAAWVASGLGLALMFIGVLV